MTEESREDKLLRDIHKKVTQIDRTLAMVEATCGPCRETVMILKKEVFGNGSDGIKTIQKVQGKELENHLEEHRKEPAQNGKLVVTCGTKQAVSILLAILAALGISLGVSIPTQQPVAPDHQHTAPEVP